MKKSKPIKDFLSAEELADIEKAVETAERTTIGEIRVTVVPKSRSGLYRVFSPAKAVEMRAFREFRKMGVHKTRERTGVFVMVSVAERRIRIIADEGIQSRVESNAWDGIVEMISSKIKGGKQKEGIIAAIARVGEILARHFPPRKGDTNELPDEVVVQD
jgi:putative membrane protein